jgi:SAM-dependent methyltransferase
VPDDTRIVDQTATPANGLPDEAKSPVALTLNAEVHRICIAEGGYPAKWPRHRYCPCCGTGRLRSIFTKYQFNHSQCMDCDFVCVNPYPPEDIIKKIYAGGYYTNFREFYEAKHLREVGGHSITAAPLELLERMIASATRGREKGNWLDVGGGLGTVADLVRQRCPGWAVTLNEFNPRSLELARDIYGLDTVGNVAGELYKMRRRFDVISAVSVLEHIPDPLPFLRSYAELLKRDGTIVVIIPHFTRLNATVSRAASPNATPPFHVSLFQSRCLDAIFRRVGLFGEVGISQFGPAAFSLLHHYDTSGYWDVTIPSLQEPVPKSFKIKEYPTEIAIGLNALGQAEAAVEDYFAESDGRLYLTAVARINLRKLWVNKLKRRFRVG